MCYFKEVVPFIEDIAIISGSKYILLTTSVYLCVRVRVRACYLVNLDTWVVCWLSLLITNNKLKDKVVRIIYFCN